jgi:hypothetical protein
MKRKLLPMSGYQMGGGDSGGGGAPTQSTSYQTNIPEYAKPYVETMLGATQKQLFQGTPTEGGGFDITGFQPYKAYGGTYDAAGNQTSYDPSKGISGFQPLQTTAQQGIAGMQVPGAYGQAMGATQQSMQNLQNASYQGGNFDNQFQAPGQYQPGQFSMGETRAPNLENYQFQNAPQDVRAQTYDAPTMQGQQTGYNPNLQNFQMDPAERVRTRSFAQPGAADAYMSPYMQNVVDIQKREAQRQSGIQGTQQQAQAVGAGAFGGSRDAIMRAERERNLNQQMGDIQATGSQAAFGQAQQQFNAEQQARLQAQQANQQAGLTRGSQNLAANLGVQQLGTQTGLQTALANLNNQQQAAVQNQAAQLQTQGMNAQQAMQAALANQQMGFNVGAQNLAANLGVQQLGSGQNMQSQLANQQALQQAQNAAEQSRQFGAGQGLQAAGLGAQYGLAGQQLGEQSRQYGANYGMQANQAALGAANQLAGLGQQQLAAQQGIYGLQNQFGAQQQALEQQKLNQAQQDYANAQQYPLMQLGTMSNMIRGLPMQAQTTQQYQAQPSLLTQGIGAAGAAASLMGAFGKAEGGVIKSMAKGGIASYDVGGEVEHDLNTMDEAGLQRQLKESSSQTIKRIAQRLLREKQMESQQRRLAGGGIIAFKESTDDNNQSLVTEEKKPEPTSSEMLQQRVMQGKPTGNVMAQPQGIIQAAPTPAPKPTLTSLQAVQADPNIPDVLKSQISDQQARADRPLQDIMAEKKAMYAAAGLGDKGQEERANFMKERVNAEDEATRNRYLQAAKFFAQWGSTPGSTLQAGLIAVRDRIPDIIDNEKEIKKIRMDINKSIASLDDATRLEKRGEIDAASAIKEKDAAKMQELYLKLSEYEMQAKKDKAAEDKMAKQEELKAERERERDNRLTTSHEKIAQAQIAGNLAVEQLRSKAENARIASASADRKDQAKWAQLTSMYKSSESAISGINDIRNRKDYIANKAIVDRAEALKSLDPEGKVPPQFAATYPKALEKLNELELEIAESKKNIQSRVRLYEKRIFGEDFDMSSNAPSPKPTGGADKKDRPPIGSFQKN